MGFSQILYSWTIIFPLIVILYYFFRKKYVDERVSSTLFWAEIMQETRVSPYLKHLQKNALLYLQVLALLLLMLALMNPYRTTSEIAGAQAVFIVDTSATMLAGKEQSTFARHKEEMKALVKELQGRPVTIITTGYAPTAIVQQETNEADILRAVDKLDVMYETANMERAFDVAQAFIADNPTSIYVFTDTLDKKQLPIDKENVQWIVKGAAKDLKNIAIIRFAATVVKEEVMALVQLQNDAKEEQEVTIRLFDENNKEISKETLVMPPREKVAQTFKNLPMTPMMTAKIDVEDDYKVDNAQTALIQTSESTFIVDQDVHQLIQKGFQALQPSMTMVPQNQLTQYEEAHIVTNDETLLTKMPRQMLLFGRSNAQKLEAKGEIATTNDALFAFSQLQDVYVSAVYEPFEQYETIATVGEAPFIQRTPRGDLIVLADIEDTDWPLHPSFPLFLWSVEQQLGEATHSLGIFAPNEERAVALHASDWSIFSRDGEYVAQASQLLRAPTLPGIYYVRSGEEERQFVVQLQAQERVIEEGTSYTIGVLENSAQEHATQSSIVPWLIAIILVLLMAEWEVQRRRGFTH